MQTLIVVDYKDSFIRYEPKDKCHSGEGIQHRAIMMLVHNSQRRILLQKRKHELFDDMWDLAGATHPLHLDDHDESYEECAARCLQVEWGIEAASVQTVAFTYYAAYKTRCENEYCMVMAAMYDGELHPHPDHTYTHRWITWDELASEIANEPEVFTPWLKLAIENLEGYSYRKEFL